MLTLPEQIKVYRQVEAAENYLSRAMDQLDQARRQGAASRELDQLNTLIRDSLLTIAAALRELLPEGTIEMRTANPAPVFRRD